MKDCKMEGQYDVGKLMEFRSYKGIDYQICANDIANPADPDGFVVYVDFGGRDIEHSVSQDTSTVSEYASLGDARGAARAIIDNYLRRTKPREQQPDTEYPLWLVRFPEEVDTTVIQVTGEYNGTVYYYDYNSDIEQMIQKDELEIVSTEGIRPWSAFEMDDYVGKAFFNQYTGATAVAIAHKWNDNKLVFYDGEISWEEPALNLLMSCMVDVDGNSIHAGVIRQ